MKILSQRKFDTKELQILGEIEWIYGRKQGCERILKKIEKSAKSLLTDQNHRPITRSNNEADISA